ncbi:MAG: DUF2269 domain-containing protein [Gammaproteobacteria bacterium]|nr:DUF2269 domain-containing protein [Gammaproteobacteria bacterium]
MSLFLWIKLVHIVSATVLFGTGMGTAFFMLKAYLSGNDEAMKVTTNTVVLADWVFTMPAVVVQFVTGLWLTTKLKIAYDSSWFIAVILLYALVGLCWIPVVWIQIRIRDLIGAGAVRRDYRRLMHVWMALGVPAFSAVLIIFYLMVSKLGAYT